MRSGNFANEKQNKGSKAKKDNLYDQKANSQNKKPMLQR